MIVDFLNYIINIPFFILVLLRIQLHILIYLFVLLFIEVMIDCTVPLYFRAGKPPVGLHLDVLKGDKLIQKLMIDEKKCYLFGRNAQMNDFCIDHASCSRVHAALVYHKHLNRAFLVDLGSSKHSFYSAKKEVVNV